MVMQQSLQPSPYRAMKKPVGLGRVMGASMKIVNKRVVGGVEKDLNL